MFIIIVFRLGCDRPSGLHLFVPAVLFSILTPLFFSSASVLLSYFILAVSMRECLGKHSCIRFLIFYCHTERYLLLTASATASGQCVFGAKKVDILVH